MGFVDVCNRALSGIKPSFSERNSLLNFAFGIKSLLNKALVSNGITGDVALGGSLAKGTFLRGSHDVDVFVRLPEKFMSRFSDVVLSVFPDAVEVHGSRLYYKVSREGFIIELIPALLIDSPLKAVNSMDASFFHVDYVNSLLNDSLRDDVILLKRFCKSCNVYGAESHIGGFSGYVIELLIGYFKGFRPFLEFVNNSPAGFFVDIEVFYESISKAFSALKVVSSLNPVVIVDPVFPLRNASAGLMREAWERFVLNARLFLNKPSASFFNVVSRSIDDLRDLALRRGHSFFSHKLVISDKSDVFFSKLVKGLGKVVDFLSREGFSVYDFGFLDDGTVFFELERDVLPLTKRVVGPSVFIDSVNFLSFISREAVYGPYIHDSRVCFDVFREFTRAKPLISKLIKRFL